MTSPLTDMIPSGRFQTWPWPVLVPGHHAPSRDNSAAITARCGGPAVCDECYEDALMWGDGSAEPQGVISANGQRYSSSTSACSPKATVPPQFVRGNRRDRRAAKSRNRR